MELRWHSSKKISEVDGGGLEYEPGPGQTQLTRMPLEICWLDRARVKATMAPY
jgi:hypothetical protein